MSKTVHVYTLKGDRAAEQLLTAFYYVQRAIIEIEKYCDQARPFDYVEHADGLLHNAAEVLSRAALMGLELHAARGGVE